MSLQQVVLPGDRDQVVNLSNIEAVQKAITKLKTKGYTLKEVNSDKAETYNSGANTVTLRSGGQLLKYVFAVPTPEVTKTFLQMAVCCETEVLNQLIELYQ